MTTRTDGPPRVLQVFGRMDLGGAETLMMNVYRRLGPRRVRMDFAVHSAEPGYYDEEIHVRGGRIFVLPQPGPAELLAGLPRYRRALGAALRAGGPYRAVHSHVQLFGGAVLAAAAAHGVPVRIAHSHTTGDAAGGGVARCAYRAVARALIGRSATHMAGCSAAACRALFGPRLAGAAAVAPNGISLAPYADLGARRAELRAALGLPAGALALGHVGRLAAVKNHAFMLDVFATLLAERPDAVLLLAGDGPERPAIEARAAALGVAGRVRLLGPRDDVPDVLGALDLFLFPSCYEGLGVALVEAQAAGVPALASDAVPPEADVGLGLVRFAPLAHGARRWAEAALEHAHAPRPAWVARAAAIRAAGYDLEQLAARLAGWYCQTPQAGACAAGAGRRTA